MLGGGGVENFADCERCDRVDAPPHTETRGTCRDE